MLLIFQKLLHEIERLLMMRWGIDNEHGKENCRLFERLILKLA